MGEIAAGGTGAQTELEARDAAKNASAARDAAQASLEAMLWYRPSFDDSVAAEEDAGEARRAACRAEEVLAEIKAAVREATVATMRVGEAEDEGDAEIEAAAEADGQQ
ncbi:hypothetical protein SCUCBS95973_008984 [Sporothrix curviconia]|uniref:Uncharacterized protein n=1 Tax=Sporothrix curviconia TaxID=1260050 RepID=A0ABP0CRQ7_9PEZI